MQEGVYTVNVDGTNEHFVAADGKAPSWQAVQVTDPAGPTPTNSTGVLSASTTRAGTVAGVAVKAPNTGYAPADSSSAFGFLLPIAIVVVVVTVAVMRSRRLQQLFR